MPSPRYPEISVELPHGPATGILRSRVQKALAQAGLETESDQYIEATEALRQDSDGLLVATKEWVTITEAETPEFVVDTAAVSRQLSVLAEPVPGAQRWQYAVVNVGVFNSPDRMSAVLSVGGANGWELIGVYDKSSNWFQGIEKGFMLLKRPIPDGATPSTWCLTLRN